MRSSATSQISALALSGQFNRTRDRSLSDNSGHCWILVRDGLSASDLDIQARPLLGLTVSANLLSTADEVIE
jgi:hypothetical protein